LAATEKNCEKRFRSMQERYLMAISEGRRGYIPLDFVSCSEEEKTLELALTVSFDLLNHSGIMHGGMCATVFDVAMGFTTNMFSEAEKEVTVELQTSYLRPIPEGIRLHVRCYAQMIGRSISHIRCEAFDEKNPGRILAAGTAVYHAII